MPTLINKAIKSSRKSFGGILLFLPKVTYKFPWNFSMVTMISLWKASTLGRSLSLFVGDFIEAEFAIWSFGLPFIEIPFLFLMGFNPNKTLLLFS
jgi:hypothetical protein